MGFVVKPNFYLCLGALRNNDHDYYFRAVRSAQLHFLSFILLIKEAERIIFYILFLLNYDITTIKAFPPLKIKKLINENLQYH